jgi:hypothetical protein
MRVVVKVLISLAKVVSLFGFAGFYGKAVEFNRFLDSVYQLLTILPLWLD